MKKSDWVLWVATMLLLPTIVLGQNIPEREHRIRKSQFPIIHHVLKETRAGDIRKLRYYREIDSAGTRYILKFRKQNLRYHMDFDEEARLLEIGFRVKEVDIPETTYENILHLLESKFDTYRVRRIYQLYPASAEETDKELGRRAFQNLLLPDIEYEFICGGRISGKRALFHIRFDAAGSLLKFREEFPPDYDHVLY